jgi:hypothetical protein
MPKKAIILLVNLTTHDDEEIRKSELLTEA